MAGLRLSTDILSPINSDFSINDDSPFSFECSAGTLDFEKHIKSLGNSPHQKGSSFKHFSTNEKNASFEMILNDIERQSAINIEKEEKFRSTYEQLKKSMDDMFNSKASSSDVPSPIRKQVDLESTYNTENITCGLKTDKIEEAQQTSEAATDTCLPFTSECISKVPIKKSQENATKSKKDRKSNRPSKNNPHSKETLKTSSSKVNARNENDVKSSDVRQERQRIPSSIRTSETMKVKKEDQSLMSQFRNRRDDVPLTVASIENKAMSIEKSVQIAISMQLDGIRNLMMDQNISLRKEMLILQEMARKQSEVTGYLFSVVEDLLETNKKLISKRD